MQAFAHAPRMHAVDEIPSPQTVASLTKYVESRASRHDQMNSVTVGVEKPLSSDFHFLYLWSSPNNAIGGLALRRSKPVTVSQNRLGRRVAQLRYSKSARLCFSLG